MLVITEAKLIKESPKAALVSMLTDRGDTIERWIPKSQSMYEADDDGNLTSVFLCKDWIIQKIGTEINQNIQCEDPPK